MIRDIARQIYAILLKELPDTQNAVYRKTSVIWDTKAMPLDMVIAIINLQEEKVKAIVRKGEATKAFLLARETFVEDCAKKTGLTKVQVRDMLRYHST